MRREVWVEPQLWPRPYSLWVDPLTPRVVGGALAMAPPPKGPPFPVHLWV